MTASNFLKCEAISYMKIFSGALGEGRKEFNGDAHFEYIEQRSFSYIWDYFFCLSTVTFHAFHMVKLLGEIRRESAHLRCLG